MTSLEQLRIQIDAVVKQIQEQIRTAYVPENSMQVRDRAYGMRQISLLLNLDEFSPENLTAAMPLIQNFYRQYVDLRAREKEVLQALEIESETRRNVVNQIRHTP